MITSYDSKDFEALNKEAMRVHLNPITEEQFKDGGAFKESEEHTALLWDNSRLMNLKDN